jgi:hypothetical protein
MADLKEQHVCISWGKNSTDTSEMLKVAFGEKGMGRTQVFEWILRFKSSVRSV